MRAVTSPTRRPVNGPGPIADRDRGEVLADDARGRHREVDERRQLLGVLHRPLGEVLGHQLVGVGVVQGHGDQRGRGVEGEEHAPKISRCRTLDVLWIPC